MNARMQGFTIVTKSVTTVRAVIHVHVISAIIWIQQQTNAMVGISWKAKIKNMNTSFISKFENHFVVYANTQ